MSITLTLIPLAVAVGVSVSLSAANVALVIQQNASNRQSAPPVLETRFTDHALLYKTLAQHGLQVAPKSKNEMIVHSDSGTLRYFRDVPGEPFLLELHNVANMDELLSALNELENEYGRNVQTFTYNKVMESLAAHGMTVYSEEILEDDTILLTLNLE